MIVQLMQKKYNHENTEEKKKKGINKPKRQKEKDRAKEKPHIKVQQTITYINRQT
jgi:hypothetical protein